MNSEYSGLEHPWSKHPFFKFLLYFWLTLLVPWFLLAPLSGMAFDGGPVWQSYVFVWAVWTYPLSVIAVFMLRKTMPISVFLPILNIAAILVSN
jgi:hypothetical protein